MADHVDSVAQLHAEIAQLRAALDESQCALEGSRLEYQQLVDASVAGLYKVDFLENRFVAVNDLMCTYSGYTREEFLALSPFTLLSAESRRLFAERLQKLMAGEQVPKTVEYKIRGKNDREFWVRINALHYKQDGMIRGATVVVHDISETKKSELARKEAEERYNALFENSLLLIYLHDLGGRFLEANEQTLRLLGYSSEELLQLSLADLVHEADLPCLLERVQQIKQTGKEAQIEEVRLKTKDGQQIWVATSAISLAKEGRPYAVLSLARDITYRKEAELERKKLEEQLRQVQKMDALGTLAGGVAHDLNNMLTAITGLATLAISSLERDTSERDTPVTKDLQEILRACTKGNELTKNLMGFARKGKFSRKPVSLNVVITELLELLKRTAPKQVELHTGLDPALGLIEGDAGQLHHVLLNLAVNAWQAMEGPGVITFRTRNRYRSGSVGEAPAGQPPGHYVELRVRDTGKGMDEVVLQQAFEPFFTTKPEGEGTGLGLSMVYGTIKNHGGQIRIKSAPGKGTEVIILLPRIEQAVSAEQESEAPSSSHRSSGTILVVDDEPSVLQATARLLKSLGYRVITAADGEEAVEIFRAWQREIALVLLDMVMPKMSGPEAFEQLLSINPDVKVLFCSGYTGDENPERLIDAGAMGFLQKPYSKEQLLHWLSFFSA